MRLASFCEEGLILWGRPHSVRLDLTLRGQASVSEARLYSVRPDLIMWIQISLCEATPNYVRPDLIMWGQTSFCEPRPHSVSPDLNLWGQTSLCEARPHSVRPALICEAGLNHIPLQLALLFQQMVVDFFLNFCLANQTRPQNAVHAFARFMSSCQLPLPPQTCQPTKPAGDCGLSQFKFTHF